MTDERVVREELATASGVAPEVLWSLDWLREHRRLQADLADRLLEELGQYSDSGEIPPALPHQRASVEWMTVEPCGDNDPEDEHDDQVDAAQYEFHHLSPARRHGQSPYLTGRVSPRWRLRHDPPVRIVHLNWPTQQVGDVDWLSPDASSMEFNLERTEHCWRDDCGAESDPKSETGLCTGCRNDLRSRWTD